MKCPECGGEMSRLSNRDPSIEQWLCWCGVNMVGTAKAAPTPDPLSVTVPQAVLDGADEALQLGIDNTRELLANHDGALGRTHRHNRLTAEAMESDILRMSAALALVRCAPDPTTMVELRTKDNEP